MQLSCIYKIIEKKGGVSSSNVLIKESFKPAPLVVEKENTSN